MKELTLQYSEHSFIFSFLLITDIQERMFVLHDSSQAIDFQCIGADRVLGRLTYFEGSQMRELRTASKRGDLIFSHQI